MDTSGLPFDLSKPDADVARLERCAGVTVRTCGIKFKVVPCETFPGSRMGWRCGAHQGCAGMVQSPATAVVCQDDGAGLHELAHIVLGIPDAPDGGALIVPCKDGTQLTL